MEHTRSANHGVAVVGFPYVRDEYFALFRQWPEPERIRFLLPRRWPIKDGRVVFTAPNDLRVTPASAYFWRYHHATPIVGGLLKGVIPVFPFWLWHNRNTVGVVYACSEPMLLTTLYYGLFTRLMGRKFVLFSWENIDYAEKFRGISRFVHLLLVRLNLRLAHGLMCGNSEGARIHARYGNMPIAIIPMNGVDASTFTPEPAAREHSPFPEKTIFSYIGALGYRKGVHLILQAMPAVIRQIPNAHVVIAGSGEYEGEIEQLMHGPLLRDSVTRFSWLPHHEVKRLLAVSDVFVYPSIPHNGWAEQFGYAMAEASLMQLPVISTRSGSIADVVHDGETGLLVPPGDVSALAAAMIRLGSDETLRHRMGASGREYIISRYTHEAIARKMHSFIAFL